MLRPPHTVLAVIALAALVGCAHKRCCVDCSTSAVGESSATAQAQSLPMVERGMFVIDTTAVSSAGALELQLGILPVGKSYYALAPQECQCLAAAHSSIARLLDGERRAMAASSSERSAGASRVEQEVLSHLAAEARNTDSAAALEIYYRLAEAEAQSDLLLESMSEVDVAVRGVERMRAEGLQVHDDGGAWQRQAVALRGQSIALEATIDRLSAELSRRIGRATLEAVSERIWPTTDLTVNVEPLDVEAAVALALELRPELTAARRLEQSLSTDSLHVVRGLLKAVNPVLGMVADPPELDCKMLLALLCHKDDDSDDQREAAARRAQIRAYLADREVTIAGEVRQAAADIETRLREVAIAHEQVGLWEERLANVEARRPSGGSTQVEATQARLELIRARSDLVTRVVAWKIAIVKYREAQGLLIHECMPQGASASAAGYCVQVAPAVPTAVVAAASQVATPAMGHATRVDSGAAAYMQRLRQRTLALGHAQLDPAAVSVADAMAPIAHSSRVPAEAATSDAAATDAVYDRASRDAGPSLISFGTTRAATGL